jgi:hypothetical protein
LIRTRGFITTPRPIFAPNSRKKKTRHPLPGNQLEKIKPEKTTHAASKKNDLPRENGKFE